MRGQDGSLDCRPYVDNLVELSLRFDYSEQKLINTTILFTAIAARVPVKQLGLADQCAAWRNDIARHHDNRSIDYHHVYDNDSMSIGIFKLPAGSSLPLHNHPSMTVWSRCPHPHPHSHPHPHPHPRLHNPMQSYQASSIIASQYSCDSNRVLYGSVRIRALDFCTDPCGHTDGKSCGSLARLKVDRCFTGHDSPVQLTPSSCNIHSLTAVEDCAILDVLVPPYHTGGGGSRHHTPLLPVCDHAQFASQCRNMW